MIRGDREERALRELDRMFRRNGYVRHQDAARLLTQGRETYKKGDEIRFVANSREELRQIRHWLRELHLEPAHPFRKANQYRQPIYGRERVAWLLSAMRSARRRRMARVRVR